MYRYTVIGLSHKILLRYIQVCGCNRNVEKCKDGEYLCRILQQSDFEVGVEEKLSQQEFGPQGESQLIFQLEKWNLRLLNLTAIMIYCQLETLPACFHNTFCFFYNVYFHPHFRVIWLSSSNVIILSLLGGYTDP